MGLHRGVLGAALIAMLLLAVACEPADPWRPSTKASGSPTVPTYGGPLRPLASGGYDVLRGRTRPGEPFDVTTLVVSRLEVRNNTDVPLTPVCVLYFGSQWALIDVGDEVLEPGERVHLQGPARFPRPLDDYESADTGCYTSLPSDVAREIERERSALTVGRAVTVPNLIGRRLDAGLPSFRRGLDVEVTSESTPCTRRELQELSRSVVGPGGRSGCRHPVIATQEPAPGSRAPVGDVIRVTVVTRR